MPRVGQDVFNSAAVSANRRSIEMLQARRSGQYPAIDPRSTAGSKAFNLSMAKRQNIQSGQYFPNNVVEKSTQMRMAKRQNIQSGQYFPNNVVEKSTQMRMNKLQGSMDRIRAVREQQ